jgi:hypothetical protein
MHPLPGTRLRLLIRPNSKELKKFTRFFSYVCCSNYEGKLCRLNISFKFPEGNILMLFFLLMYLKIKLVVLPYLILLAYVYPLGELETSLPSWLTNFKVSPSARCASAANVICKEIDIFNKDKITLVDIS